MKPNALHHRPDPVYLRELLQRADLSQAAAASLVGVSPRQMRYYLSTADDHQDAPYSVQFALESIADLHDLPGRVGAVAAGLRDAAEVCSHEQAALRLRLTQAADLLEELAAVRMDGKRKRDTAEHIELVARLIAGAGGQIRITRAQLQEALPITSAIVRVDDPETGDILFSIEHAPAGPVESV